MSEWFSKLRSFVFYAPLIAIATAIHGSINLVVAFFGASGETQFKVARNWGRTLLRIGGVKVTVEGLEKIRPGESFVFASNHVSYMDTPVALKSIPSEFRFMAKSGLFKVPGIGGHLTQAGHIAVDLDNPRSALRTLAAAGKMLKEHGLSVLVFPEGGRSESGEMEPFKEGAAYLAIKGQVPVVPMALIGMRDILPMHSGHLRPGKVTVRFGDPIEVSSLTLRDRDVLTQRIFDSIAELRNGKVANFKS